MVLREEGFVDFIVTALRNVVGSEFCVLCILEENINKEILCELKLSVVDQKETTNQQKRDQEKGQEKGTHE